MLQQFVDLSGKDKPEDALAYFTQLKTNSNTQPADVLALQTSITTLEKNLAAKDSVIEGVQRKQFIGELKDRTERIEALVESCRIEPAEAEPLNEAFTQIDPKLVSDTQKDADFALNFLESSKPREDLLELKEVIGSDGKGQAGKETVNSITAKIEALADEKHDGNFEKAYDEFLIAEPVLMKKYTDAT